jgi:DNA repair ATPase RecN
MKKIIFRIIAVLIIGGGIYAYLYYRVGNTGGFVSAYRDYVAKWAENEKNIYTPGAEKNDIRQNLNSILTRVLDERITDKERFSLSVEGATPLSEIRLEIDSVKTSREEMELSTDVLASQAKKVSGIRLRQKANELVDLAKKRNEIIAEIETLSYRMSDITKEIFQGVARDNGKLTNDRIRTLNNQVPEAEKDYERLNELYRNLTESKTEIKKAYTEFIKL